jgi:O-antigen/teichoic acid export membrane protein
MLISTGRSITSIRLQILANYASKAWSAIMALAFIPLYIRLLGIEAYGLIGLFSTIQAVFSILDLGMGTTLNREIARYSTLPNKSGEMRDLLRTLEVIYWAMAVVIGACVAFSAPIITHHWVKAGTLPLKRIEYSIILMGVVLAFQWPLSFYSGGLLGLQRQVLYSVFNASWYTLRFAGAGVMLLLVSPSVLTFFAWQVFVSIASTTCVAIAVWKCVPRHSSDKAPRFRRDLIHSVWRFAAGLSGISITVLILHQADKIILSRVLALADYGYYSFAWTVASSLNLLITPLFTVYFPIFSRCVATNAESELIDNYHKSSQLLSVIVLPIAVILLLFTREMLMIWTNNATLAANTSGIVRLLVIGTALNGIMTIPYALQLSYGWTRLALNTNVVAICILVPLLVGVSIRFGGIGAASIWALLNVGYILISIQFMHRRLLRCEKMRWYLHDVGSPLVAVIAISGLARLCWPNGGMSAVTSALALIFVGVLTVISAFVATSEGRHWISRNSRMLKFVVG